MTVCNIETKFLHLKGREVMKSVSGQNKNDPDLYHSEFIQVILRIARQRRVPLADVLQALIKAAHAKRDQQRPLIKTASEVNAPTPECGRGRKSSDR